jgi:predicted HTH domain antitoxin
MTVEEVVVEKLRTLSLDQQQEVLDFVEFLHYKRNQQIQARQGQALVTQDTVLPPPIEEEEVIALVLATCDNGDPKASLALSRLSKEYLEALLVKLYAKGILSTGKAAEILGIPRLDFLDMLGKHQVAEFDDALDVVQEQQHAAAARCE